MANFQRAWFYPLFFLILASGVLFFFWELIKPPYLTFSDSAKFADVGRQLVNGGGLSTNFAFFNTPDFFDLSGSVPFPTNWFPLFSVILALNFLIFETGDSVVVFTSAFFFSLSSILVFLIGRRLFGKMVGVFSALAFIFTIPMLEYGAIGASESLFIFEILLAVYLLLFPQRWTWTLAGLVAGLMFLTRPQALIYLGGLIILIFLYRRKRLAINFFAGLILLLGPLFVFGKIAGLNFFGQQPVSLLFEHSTLASPNITLRGGFNQFGLDDIFTNIKPLGAKVFYHLYNFYKTLPTFISPYLLTLYFLSFLRWGNGWERGVRATTLFLFVASILAASLTIPFVRYLHPVVPLVIILAVETLIWLVGQLVKEEKKVWLICTGFILFFVIGQTLGQIFLDTRFTKKMINKDKPPVNVILGKMVGDQTKKNDLVVTNLDTWGSWYGKRRTVWLPFEPQQLVPPEGQTKIDSIFLTSYLADNPAQALGPEWLEILNHPEDLGDPFLEENFVLEKKFTIKPEDNYYREEISGVILKRKHED